VTFRSKTRDARKVTAIDATRPLEPPVTGHTDD